LNFTPFTPPQTWREVIYGTGVTNHLQMTVAGWMASPRSGRNLNSNAQLLTTTSLCATRGVEAYRRACKYSILDQYTWRMSKRPLGPPSRPQHTLRHSSLPLDSTVQAGSGANSTAPQVEYDVDTPIYTTQIISVHNNTTSGGSKWILCTSPELHGYLKCIWKVLELKEPLYAQPLAKVDATTGRLLELSFQHPDSVTAVLDLSSEAEPDTESPVAPSTTTSDSAATSEEKAAAVSDAAKWKSILDQYASRDAELDATIQQFASIQIVDQPKAREQTSSEQAHQEHVSNGRERRRLSSMVSTKWSLIRNSYNKASGGITLNKEAFTEVWNRLAARLEMWIRKAVTSRIPITVDLVNRQVASRFTTFWQSVQATPDDRGIPLSVGRPQSVKSSAQSAKLLSPAEQAVLFAPLTSDFLKVHNPLPPKQSKYKGKCAFRLTMEGSKSSTDTTYTTNLIESIRDVLAARLVNPDASASRPERPRPVGRAPSVLHDNWMSTSTTLRSQKNPTAQGSVSTYLASAQDTAMRCRRAMLLAAAVAEADQDIEALRLAVRKTKGNTEQAKALVRASPPTSGMINENPGGMGLFWKYPGQLM